MLIKFSYRFLPIMLHVEPRMVVIFWAHNPISFYTRGLLASILGATPNHRPLKQRCSIKISNQIRHVYLIMLLSSSLTLDACIIYTVRSGLTRHDSAWSLCHVIFWMGSKNHRMTCVTFLCSELNNLHLMWHTHRVITSCLVCTVLEMFIKWFDRILALRSSRYCDQPIAG